jgi:hypothetical protein
MNDISEKPTQPGEGFIKKMSRAGRAICAEAETQKIIRPSFPDLFMGTNTLPQISGFELNAETLGAGLLHHGALLVRQLYNSEHLAELNQMSVRFGQANLPKHTPLASVPEELALVLDIYRDCGLLGAIGDYMGATPLLHLERAKLRRHMVSEAPYIYGVPWHQDGAFFERTIYGVNCWAAVSACGAQAPGIIILPRRLEEVVGWNLADGIAPVDYGKLIPKEEIRRVSQGYVIAEPDLQPGDAILFDEMTLHRSSRPKPNALADQIVTISWFFRGPGFPQKGLPLAIQD